MTARDPAESGAPGALGPGVVDSAALPTATVGEPGAPALVRPRSADAESEDVGSVGASGCRAAAILTRGGPSAVPFDVCCVMAIIRAGGPQPGPLVCGALDLLELGEPTQPQLIAAAEPAP